MRLVKYAKIKKKIYASLQNDCVAQNIDSSLIIYINVNKFISRLKKKFK